MEVTEDLPIASFDARPRLHVFRKTGQVAGFALLDADRFAAGSAIVTWQFRQPFAVIHRPHSLEQRAETRIIFLARGKAKIVGLIANLDKFQPGFLARESNANANIGPAAMDG